MRNLAPYRPPSLRRSRKAANLVDGKASVPALNLDTWARSTPIRSAGCNVPLGSLRQRRFGRRLTHVQPYEALLPDRPTQPRPSAGTELVVVANSEVSDDIVMRAMLAVVVSERSEHALDGDPRCVHGEGITLESLELIGVAHALEGGVPVVRSGRRHQWTVPRGGGTVWHARTRRPRH